MRFRPVALAALIIGGMLFLANGRPTAAQTDSTLLRVDSSVRYDIKTTADGAVHVAWDVTLTDNDPATTITGRTVAYYYYIGLPILRGASNITATDSVGNSLQTETKDPGNNRVDEGALVYFARRLFYGNTYKFQLTYDLVDTRSEGILVTPTYAYIPVLAEGDQSTVIVNTPPGEPWVTTLEAAECQQTGNTFSCSGSDRIFLAAQAEVLQPHAMASLKFDVPLKSKTVHVTLSYFSGDDALGVHQQALITAGLPIIEQAYGFDYAGPATADVQEGGRQSSLGAEGIASCNPDVSCEIVISPVAGDYTLLHELSHMWSNVYKTRWLAEGFAEFVAETVGPQLPAGLVTGNPPLHPDPPVALALDDWGGAQSIIGADVARLQVEEAGYTFSFRFLQALRDQFGIEGLQAANRNIATGGTPVSSQRYMDLLEEATSSNLDSIFETWVFPASYKGTLANRRSAIDRLAQLRSRLTAVGLPDDIASPIEAKIHSTDYADALGALDAAEAGLETYGALRAKLDKLEADAQAAGLTMPGALTGALNRFDFNIVSTSIVEGNDAVPAYVSARSTVDESRSIWKRFGLLGSNPGDALKSAATSFANGDFALSRQQSLHASVLVNDASTVAFRRLLIVAGFLSLIVLALAVAFVVSRLRRRARTGP